MMQHSHSQQCFDCVRKKINSFNKGEGENKLSQDFKVYYQEYDGEEDCEIMILEIESDRPLDQEDLRRLNKKFEGFQAKSDSKLKYDSAGNPYSVNVAKLTAILR
jgi:hypothetical protein